MKDKRFERLQGTDDYNLDEDKTNKILVLGIGNYLMGDEGVGVHIVHRMEEMKGRPDYIDVLDGGTGGFFLMNVFDDYGQVIFVDATMDGQPSGTIKTLKPKFASDFPNALSVHDVGLKDMIEALYILESMPELHLVTISVEGIQPMTTDMTANVEASIPKAIKAILDLAQSISNVA